MKQIGGNPSLLRPSACRYSLVMMAVQHRKNLGVPQNDSQLGEQRLAHKLMVVLRPVGLLTAGPQMRRRIKKIEISAAKCKLLVKVEEPLVFKN
jgi:hypothetical protein